MLPDPSCGAGEHVEVLGSTGTGVPDAHSCKRCRRFCRAGRPARGDRPRSGLDRHLKSSAGPSAPFGFSLQRRGQNPKTATFLQQGLRLPGRNVPRTIVGQAVTHTSSSAPSFSDRRSRRASSLCQFGTRGGATDNSEDCGGPITVGVGKWLSCFRRARSRRL